MGEREKRFQKDIRRVYALLPVMVPPHDIVKYNRELIKRGDAEINKKLIEKLQGLVSESTTTLSFKKTLIQLANKIAIGGTLNFKEQMIQKWGELFIEVLALDHSEGIYNPNVAMRSEMKLRDAALKSFISQITSDEETGRDIRKSEFWMSPFFEDFDEGKELLLNWRKEFRILYNQSPASAQINEAVEDLIFKGPPDN